MLLSHGKELQAQAGVAAGLGGPVPTREHITKRLPLCGRFLGSQLETGEQGVAKNLELDDGICFDCGFGDRLGVVGWRRNENLTKFFTRMLKPSWRRAGGNFKVKQNGKLTIGLGGTYLIG